MEEYPRSKNIFVTKHVAKMCGVGKFMFRWKGHDKPNCPRRGQFEDALHVWLCAGCDVNSIWKETLDKLSNWLSPVQTDPDVQAAILEYLNGWRNDFFKNLQTSADLSALVQYQTTQGWRTFFRKWIPLAWEEIQLSY
jgi:hypothetical protein